MMAAQVPPRLDNIEIPDRPAVTSRSEEPRLRRKRVLLYGGIVAAALLFVVAMALLQSGSDEVARAPANAPVIRAGDDFKVSPADRGGIEVPNREIRAYGRLHGAPDNKQIELLGPQAEQPETPPASPSSSEMAGTPSASETESSLAPFRPGIEWLSEPPLPEPPARPAAEAGKAPPPVVANPKLSALPSPSPPPPAPAANAPAKMPSQPAPPPQVRVANAPTSTPSTAQPDKPVSGKGFHLQLLSSRSADEAKGAWVRLREKNGDLLGPLSPSVARADLADRGTFYRLRAGPVASELKGALDLRLAIGSGSVVPRCPVERLG